MTAIAEATRPTAAGPWFYARVAALGFVLIALGGLVLLGLAAVQGELVNVLPFAGTFLVGGLLLAALAWRFRTWPLVIAGILSLVLLAFLGPFALFGLMHPEAANEFVPVVLVIGGAAVGFVGSILGLVQRVLKRARVEATPVEEIAWKALLAAMALASLGSPVLTYASRTTVSAEAKTGAVNVELHNFQFTPDRIQAQAGEKVRLVIKNDDTALHTFTFEQAGINQSIPPGAERLIEFQAPAKGTYTFYCIPHSHDGGTSRQGMTGTLIVE